MYKKLTLLIGLSIASSQAQARGIDLKLADEMAEINFLTQTSTFGYGGTDLGAGILFTENDDFQFNGQMMITGNPAGNNKALQMGIGGKLTFVSLDANNTIDEEFGALAVGGQIRYVIPSTMPVAFKAGLFYAPSITSFSGADDYTEVSFAVELEVTPSARAYVGYRKMEYELESGVEVELDDGGHFGLKFDF